MTTLPSGLPVVVERSGQVPLAVQISAQLQAAVTGGALRAGDRLPSSRDLAATLGVSRTVVTNAYARLFAEGWLEGRHGSGTYVADVTLPPSNELGQWPDGERARRSAAADVQGDPERTHISPSQPSSPSRPAGAKAPEKHWRDSLPQPLVRAGGLAESPGSAPGRDSLPQPLVRAGGLAESPGSAPGRDSVPQLFVRAGGPDTIAPFAIRPARTDTGGYGGSSPRETTAGYGGSSPRETTAGYGGSSPRETTAGYGGSSPRETTDLQPGISWAEGIEPAAWRRAWRQAGAHLPSRWPDPHGLPELREEIAAYLRRSRGLAVSPAHVLITQGVSNGLALLADALLAPGDRAGIEEPGYPTGREVLRRAGARVVPCRVDAHGIVPEELPGDLRLLYTTPAHQYPLGGRLPVNRRQALIAWAWATGALVVEDDYDSEFRYDVGPLPALHSMDPDVIVYLGTASKVLATAFGAGWLIAPPDLVERLAALRPRLGARIPEPVQYAILALLRSGDLERHVRKMRLEYARRRAALVDALTHGERGDAGENPARAPYRLLGDTAGMHVVVQLPDDYPAARLVEAAARLDVTVYPLDRYFAGPPTMSGLILGYGTATLPQLRRAAAKLAPLLARLP